MSWPERFKTNWKRLNLSMSGQLTLKSQTSLNIHVWDLPMLQENLLTMPAVLNATNEMAVEQFLKEKIFQEIPTFISKTPITYGKLEFESRIG